MKALHQLTDWESAVAQVAFGGYQRVALTAVANHIADACQPDQNARTVGIAQTALNVVLVEQVFVYLARLAN